MVVVLQTVLGVIEFVGDAWVLMFYFALCILALAVGYRAATTFKSIGAAKNVTVFNAESFATLLLIGGLFSVVLALVQSLDVWTTESWVHRMPGFRRPGANLGQPNQLATLVLFSVGSLAYLFEGRRISTPIAVPVAAILLLGVAVTESRTGILSLFLMALWWALMRRRVASRLSVFSAVMWVIFAVLCLKYWPIFIDAFYANVGEAGSTPISLRAGTRMVIWPQLWSAAMLHPWFGWGLKEVSEAHNSVLHAYIESEPFTYAHNLVLELVVGIGLPLTALLAGMTGVWLWHRVHRIQSLLAWYCVLALIPFCVHSMLEFPFSYAYLLLPAMVLLGMLEACVAPERVMRIPWRVAIAFWTFFCATMAWSAVEYVSIEEDFRVARFEAVHLGHTAEDYKRPHITLLTQLDALLEGPRIVPMPAMDAAQINLARRIALHFPGPATQNRYALSLALNGNPDEAIRQLLVIRAMHGESAYRSIKRYWSTLAEEKYPQLAQLNLP
jgi:O-antigen ligase